MSVTITPKGTASSHQLEGGKNFFSSDDIKFRVFDEGKDLADVRKLVLDKDNNLDEVVFRGEDNRLYVIYADELLGKVAKGDGIEVDGIRGTVVDIDNEMNEMAKIPAAVGLVAVGVVAGVAIGGTLGVVGAAAMLGKGTGLAGASVAMGGGFMLGGAVGGVAGGAHQSNKLEGAFKTDETNILQNSRMVTKPNDE